MIIDTTELAKRLGVTRSRAIQLIHAGRIPGAVKVGKAERGVWAIEVPSDAPPVILPAEKQTTKKPRTGRGCGFKGWSYADGSSTAA